MEKESVILLPTVSKKKRAKKIDKSICNYRKLSYSVFILGSGGQEV